MKASYFYEKSDCFQKSSEKSDPVSYFANHFNVWFNEDIWILIPMCLCYETALF